MQVYQRFLQQNWDQLHLPNVVNRGSFPSVALMRLSMHGQTDREKLAIIDAYFKCPLDVRRVLVDEMNKSGIDGQVQQVHDCIAVGGVHRVELPAN